MPKRRPPWVGTVIARVLESFADVAPRFLRELDTEKVRDVIRSDKPMTRIVVALERVRRSAVVELARRGDTIEGQGGDVGPN